MATAAAEKHPRPQPRHSNPDVSAGSQRRRGRAAGLPRGSPPRPPGLPPASSRGCPRVPQGPRRPGRGRAEPAPSGGAALSAVLTAPDPTGGPGGPGEVRGAWEVWEAVCLSCRPQDALAVAGHGISGSTPKNVALHPPRYRRRDLQDAQPAERLQHLRQSPAGVKVLRGFQHLLPLGALSTDRDRRRRAAPLGGCSGAGMCAESCRAERCWGCRDSCLCKHPPCCLSQRFILCVFICVPLKSLGFCKEGLFSRTKCSAGLGC